MNSWVPKVSGNKRSVTPPQRTLMRVGRFRAGRCRHRQSVQVGEAAARPAHHRRHPDAPAGPRPHPCDSRLMLGIFRLFSPDPDAAIDAGSQMLGELAARWRVRLRAPGLAVSMVTVAVATCAWKSRAYPACARTNAPPNSFLSMSPPSIILSLRFCYGDCNGIWQRGTALRRCKGTRKESPKEAHRLFVETIVCQIMDR